MRSFSELLHCGSPSRLSVSKNGTTESMLALMSALGQQPVSVAIEADPSSFPVVQDRCDYSNVRTSPFFQLYKTSVITATCETELDHGVLTVGYRTKCGTEEWKANCFVQCGKGEWRNVASCLVHHRILSCLRLNRQDLHFQTQQHLRRLHTLPRITGAVIWQRAW